MPGNPNAETRILLGQLASNGDCLYATTLARQIKHDYPSSHLTWAISSKCRHLLVNNPFVDDIWEVSLDSWGDYVKSWREFESEARRCLASGKYDRFIPSQIYPGRLENYDGTIRPSIFRAYGAPITVPIRSILRTTADERLAAESFLTRHGLTNEHRIVLFECSSKSGQSFVTPEWALEVAALAGKHLPKVKFILSSHIRIETDIPCVIDGSTLSMRETSELLPRCAAFVGCGSGLTVIAATLEQSPDDLPIVQFLLRDTSVYASFAEDLRYWGLSNERFIESCDQRADTATDLLVNLMHQGLSAAKAQYHRPAPLNFNYYLEFMRNTLLKWGEPCRAVDSLKHLVDRFGWDDALRRYAKLEMMPHLVELKQKGDTRSALSLTKLWLLFRQGRDRDSTQAGEFTITRVNDQVLKSPIRIQVNAREDPIVWKQMANVSLAKLEKAINERHIECPPDRRGDDIAKATFIGEWLALPGRKTLISDFKPGQMPRTENPDFQPVQMLRKYSMSHLPELSRRILSALDKIRRVPGRALKYLLDLLGIRKYASVKWAKFRSEYLGIGREHRRKTLSPVSVEAVPPQPAAWSGKIIITGDIDRLRRENRFPGAVILGSGYGAAPELTEYTLRPAPKSFIHWLGHEFDECSSAVEEYIFMDYDGRLDDAKLLTGMLRRSQRLGFHIECSAIPDLARQQLSFSAFDDANGIVYYEPGTPWLDPAAYPDSSGILPKISVVVPCYNQSEFVSQTLDSIFSQDYPELETIVIDPGSTDGSREIIESHRDKITRCVFEPDRGQSDALQKGFNLASGEILTWLCSDDLLAPGALRRIAKAFEENRADVVAGGCLRIDGEGCLINRHQCAIPYGAPHTLSPVDLLDLFDSFEKSNYFFQPELFFTRTIWEKSGSFLWNDAYYCMDYELWVRMALAGARVIHIPPALACSRSHAAQKTKTGSRSSYYQLRSFMKFYNSVFDKMQAEM